MRGKRLTPKPSLTPTQQIEKAPYRKNVEFAWMKKPRKKLVSAANGKNRFRDHLFMCYPQKGDSMAIHQHPHKKKELMVITPSLSDFDTIKLFMESKHKPRIDVIAVRRRKEVAGYTFIKPLKPINLEELREYVALRKKWLESNGKDTASLKKAMEELAKNGIKIRFVPNKKAGYELKELEFVKNNNSKKKN